MQNETKFTRGPWRIADGLVCGVEKDGKTPSFDIFDGKEWAGPKDEGMANARLIAAAPELYEALKQMNHMCGDERGGYCICPRNDGSATDNEHATFCVDARAAIAKAEGKS